MSLYQGIAEGLFDLFYLTSVITMGVLMVRGATRGSAQSTAPMPSGKALQSATNGATTAHHNRLIRLFGMMAITLGVGDSFHLVPRVYGLLTTGLADHYMALNIGKMITSVTMTVFYLILYHVYLLRYAEGQGNNRKGTLTVCMYLCAAVRIVLSLLPQNQWLTAEPSFLWGVYRNIPFALMGGVVICLFARQSYQEGDPLRWAWLAVTLSFLFYIPVVLWAHVYPLVGVLMIPKTIAYLWLVRMGYNLHRQY